MPGAFDLPKAEKYGLVAVDCWVDHDVPDQVQVGDGLWACRSMGMEPPPHWREWIGTIRFDVITKAPLILLARGPGRAPTVLDADNEALVGRANELFWGLLLTNFVRIDNIALTLTGANNGDEVDVRSQGELDQIWWPTGISIPRVTTDQLREAGVLAKAMQDMRGSDLYVRFWRSVTAFRDGITSSDAGRRIHQFVRSVEGFILPDQGATERQFKARTELFIGSRLHALTQELYRVRSAVEHLHGPEKEIAGATERHGGVIVVQRSVEAEALARYCLRHLLLHRDLWPYFRDDASLGTFWTLSPQDRAARWGTPLAMHAVTAAFNPDRVHD